MLSRWYGLLLIVTGACLLAPVTLAQEDPVPTFGTTVVIPSGLRGDVYYVSHWSKNLPDFKKLKPKGTIYTTSLNIPPQNFRQGFPGVTKRFEWFAIDYTGKFWISKPGSYRFDLLSDDGAKLYIDGQVVADNDGVHPPEMRSATIQLKGGVHTLRVSYFQGPGQELALVLKVAGEGEDLRIFSTDEFKPPPNLESWDFPETGEGKKQN